MPDNPLPPAPLPHLQPRPTDSHKGDFGRALLIGGSRSMPGAISLAGLACCVSGAGLVRVAIPASISGIVAGHNPSAMLVPLDEQSTGNSSGLDRRILCPDTALPPGIPEGLRWASCVAIGPGLGHDDHIDRFVPRVIEHAITPVVVDADGLNALGSLKRLGELLSTREQPLVLTPHPGEWQRLSGVGTSDRAGQEAAAIDFCQRHNCVVLLKGSRTMITDGDTVVHNASGTPAMATGGSGDVLTGVVTALICQGLAARDAAHLGAYVHGLAGELAERRLGHHVVLPTELITSLPNAFGQAASEVRDS